MAKNHRVVVTGLGIISPIGNDVPTFWENLKKGVCGIETITEYDTSLLPAHIAGKIKDFGNRQAYSSFDSKEGFQRFDGGIRIGCGLQYDFVYAELGYDFGLANISHDYFDTSRTGAFFATVGFNF